MRLLSKISYYYFWLSLIVLGITGILLFLFLRYEVSREIEEQLELQSDMIAEEIHAGRSVEFPLVQIDSGDEQVMKLPTVFRDTLIYDRLQNENEGYYYRAESVRINQKPYRIMVMTIFIGWENYSKTIGYIFITIAIMLIVLGATINYFMNKKIWKPFLANLKQMKLYSVSSMEDLNLKDADITEFQELNAVLRDLTLSAKNEYQALKEFTENASHEIQTPLSILRTRLESISQLPVDARIVPLLGDAKQAINRLTKVNKGLLLLAKLENKTFTDKCMVALDEVLIRTLDLMDDLFEHKSIQIERHLQPYEVFASTSLMEILISNLLSNILSHAPTGAKASIYLDQYQLEIKNEGIELSFDQFRLFTRFGKGKPGYHGNGLGLSIVKQICTTQQWQIHYTYESGFHSFKIQFMKK